MDRKLAVELLSEADLPAGFKYSREYLRVVEHGLTDLDPRWIIEGELLRGRYVDLRARYKDRTLVPFAVRQDSDDVACWDAAVPNTVFIIHDFTTPARAQRASFATFYDWLRQAVEDFIEHG